MNEAGNYRGAYDLGLHDAYFILAASNAGYVSPEEALSSGRIACIQRVFRVFGGEG